MPRVTRGTTKRAPPHQPRRAAVLALPPSRGGAAAPPDHLSPIVCPGAHDIEFDAILPPSTGAILAIGSAVPTVVAMKGAVMGVGVRKEMTVTITCDHRHISGADAAMFLKDLANVIENPVLLK